MFGLEDDLRLEISSLLQDLAQERDKVRQLTHRSEADRLAVVVADAVVVHNRIVAAWFDDGSKVSYDVINEAGTALDAAIAAYEVHCAS